MSSGVRYIEVLFPIASGAFTYELPDGMPLPSPGSRVLAPFRKSSISGVVLGPSTAPSNDRIGKIRTILEIEDGTDHTFLPESLLDLINWTARYYMASPGSVLKHAVPSGVWEGRKRRKSRVPEPHGSNITVEDVKLTREQALALDSIRKDEGVFLIEGVTGSGKTEVYIRAIEEIIDKGIALVLVPEIALTGKMVERFRARFGGSLVVYHSALSEGERVFAWKSVREGRAKVVLGVRSAIFLPFEDLGMVIVDEEHSSTYKQSEGLKYNARDLAVVRGRLQNARVILGSATPSIESYYNATEGKYRLIRLTKRVRGRPMPSVHLIDMKSAQRSSASLSGDLANAAHDAVNEEGQVLLLLNRRGYSPMVLCEDCGHVRKCRLCHIALTYHKREKALKCHHCGGFSLPEDRCVECGGTRIAYPGLGTERAEEEVAALFPDIRAVRMDLDTTGRKHSHDRILKSMEEGHSQMMLGTQMVAKGHDLPGVVLAGVISADVLLGLPDFRSAEKGFQLFSQLAGRAGRGEKPGRVLIQTYEPDHYLFEFVKTHNFKGFFAHELSQRRELGYPPFTRLARIILKGRQKDKFEKSISSVREICGRFKMRGITLLGPSACPLERLRGRYRWHFLLKARSSQSLHSAVRAISREISSLADLEIDVDIDPLNMM